MHRKLRKSVDILMNLILAIISLCLYISKYHIVHLKYMQFLFSIPGEAGKINPIKKERGGLLAKMEIWVDTLCLCPQPKEREQEI